MKNIAQNIKHSLRTDPTAMEYQLEADNLAKELKKKMGLKPVKKSSKRKDGSVTEEIIWKETDRAWLNKKGIENCVGLVRGYADKINQMSDYDEVQIERLMGMMHRALARDIAENWEEYDVGKRGNADNTVELITNLAWSTFNASKGGKKMELVNDSAETVTRTTQEQKSDDGILPSLSR